MQINEELQGILLKVSTGSFRLLDLVLGCANEDEGEEYHRPPGCDELQGVATQLRDLAGVLAACFGEDDNSVSWVRSQKLANAPH